MKNQIIAAGIALVVGFLAGWTVHNWKTDSELLGQIEDRDEQITQLKSDFSEIENAYLAVAEQLMKKPQTIIRNVPKIITKDCNVNKGTVRFLDHYALTPLSEFTPKPDDKEDSSFMLSNVVIASANNYTICHREFEKLKALQQQVKRYKEVTSK